MAKEEVWGSVGLLGEVAAVVVGVACLVLEVVVVEEALLEEAGVAAAEVSAYDEFVGLASPAV